MTAAEDVQATNNNTAQLTFDPYMRDMMKSFGATPAAVDKMFETPPEKSLKQFMLEPNPSQKALAHLAEQMIRVQLHPGKQLDDLQEVFLARIHDLVGWDSMHSSIILSSTPTSRVVSLLEWTRKSLLEGATTAFFGKALLKIEPKLFENFFEFDDKSWKLTYKIPPPWCNDMIAAKKAAQDALTLYFEMPRDQRTGECWLVRALEAELRAREVKPPDIAAYLMMIYWVYVCLRLIEALPQALICTQHQCQRLEALLLGFRVPPSFAFSSPDYPYRNSSSVRIIHQHYFIRFKACRLSAAHGSLS